QLPSLLGMRSFTAMLLADGVLAREAGDGKRWIADIDSAFNLSRQLGGNSPLTLNLVSLSISESAMDQIEQTLRERPTLIRKQDWIDLATRLSAPKVAADLVTVEVERMSFDDVLQRSFTDDGSGNGRLTAEGVKTVLHFEHRNEWLKDVVAPA